MGLPVKPSRNMHYLLKPLVRLMRTMHDSELKLAIIGGFLFFIAGLLDLLRLMKL
jgi:hypothetical protein